MCGWTDHSCCNNQALFCQSKCLNYVHQLIDVRTANGGNEAATAAATDEKRRSEGGEVAGGRDVEGHLRRRAEDVSHVRLGAFAEIVFVVTTWAMCNTGGKAFYA